MESKLSGSQNLILWTGRSLEYNSLPFSQYGLPTTVESFVVFNAYSFGWLENIDVSGEIASMYIKDGVEAVLMKMLKLALVTSVYDSRFGTV